VRHQRRAHEIDEAAKRISSDDAVEPALRYVQERLFVPPWRRLRIGFLLGKML